MNRLRQLSPTLYVMPIVDAWLLIVRPKSLTNSLETLKAMPIVMCLFWRNSTNFRQFVKTITS